MCRGGFVQRSAWRCMMPTVGRPRLEPTGVHKTQPLLRFLWLHFALAMQLRYWCVSSAQAGGSILICPRAIGISELGGRQISTGAQ